MSAKFFVIGSFLVRSRNLFVAVGDATEGTILPGMRIVVDLGNLKLDAGAVACIEVIEIALKRANPGRHFLSGVRCRTSR
jgi:hypothetical protein